MLIIDGKDKIINLCEIKFANDEYVITKDYDMKLRSKVETFRRSTKTKKHAPPNNDNHLWRKPKQIQQLYTETGCSG